MKLRYGIVGAVLILGLAAGGIATVIGGGESEVEPGVGNLSGVYAAAIELVSVESGIGGKELIYVAGPSLELWDQWCNVNTDEPGEEPQVDFPGCDVLKTADFDLPARYELGSSEANEIEAALSHAEVSFIEDRHSVIEPFEEGMMIAPIRNGAGLVTFGVPIQTDGKVYMPVDTHGAGFFLELTPSDTGWKVTPLAGYIV
ncbi:MAG: hypothetical protein IH942_07905 [Acidobacteria bacterium]|nr:hypothetical protein [Acidobacteriota bacterium]